VDSECGLRVEAERSIRVRPHPYRSPVEVTASVPPEPAATVDITVARSSDIRFT
jgi:hypothetical protein